MTENERTSGEALDHYVTDEQFWTLFNRVFTTASVKQNTYKFGFLKSILDNLFNAELKEQGAFISLTDLFTKFTENYWNLVVHNEIRQAHYNGKSAYSSLERILNREVIKDPSLKGRPFDTLDELTLQRITKDVTSECKRYVIMALYRDLDGAVYSYDTSARGITITPNAYEFMLKYKTVLEKLNYYAWAEFLEKVNPPEKTTNLLDILELAVPQRKDLSQYKNFLLYEHHDTHCFYCGKSLQQSIDTDHFVPWSYIKDDKLWNMVLACPHCNRSKNNKIPGRELIYKIEQRNKELILLNHPLVKRDMASYSDNIIENICVYASMNGYATI